MHKSPLRILLAAALALATGAAAWAEPEAALLDDFETLEGWSLIASEGVHAELAQDDGHDGMGVRLDFDFRGGTGYIIVRKAFAIALPDDYAFGFLLRGEAPVNTLEFKLVDRSGNNVWWRTWRDFDFPREWRPVTVKRRQLAFAWGPAGGGQPESLGAIEFAIAAGTGGKGSVWIDELRFEVREPLEPYELTPVVRASTATEGHAPELALDPDPATSWHSGTLADSQWLAIDFLRTREYGGLVIDWDRDDYATDYQVQTSADGEHWTTAYTSTAGNGGRDYIYLPDAESRYLRLELQKSSRGQGYGIAAITVKPYEFSASPNRFFEAIAADAPRGLYPRYLAGEQSYWTVVGVSGDSREGLLNEEGMLEVDKGGFSIEPFLYLDGRLVTWDEVERTPSLERGYLPIPSVTWWIDGLALTVTAFAAGQPGVSTLYARYRVANDAAAARHVSLFLAVRPFQVNPPWQSLNRVGGVARITELAYDGHALRVNQDKQVHSLTPAEHFGAAAFNQGPITDFLLQGRVPAQTSVADPFGYASGALEYGLDLAPSGVAEVYIAVPFHPDVAAGSIGSAAAEGAQRLAEAIAGWEARLARVEIEAPPAARKLIETVKSNLGYILINRDGAAIRPGSRSYARAWIRDGALTSAALLGMGYTEEVREFIRWYAQYQYPDGKIPCCVDDRGPDPVPEHDSHGQFIFLVAEYYRYTRDVGFLTEVWPHVARAAEYIDRLRQQRLTEAYEAPDKLAYNGLLPESISHEGYASNPVHAYWDNFFALRGLKDAALLARVLGERALADTLAEQVTVFRIDLYASIARTMSQHRIDFIPGSVELGDFDPNAITIAVDPGGELEHLPEPALARTFEDYYQSLQHRRAGMLEWEAYTPYELRIVGTLVRLGWVERAHEVLDFLMTGQRPAAWNQWPEIVGRDPRSPRFLGDLPHTWVGSDFIRSVRSLFAYEREDDRALVIAAGVPEAWLDDACGVGVKRLPTYHGTLNYRLRREGPDALRLSLSGDLTVPPGGIVVRSPLARPLTGVSVNGEAVSTFGAGSATVEAFPAEVMLRY